MFGLTRPRRASPRPVAPASEVAITVIDRRPFARAEDARIAVEGPREVEEDATPSSRPSAVAEAMRRVEVGDG